jgi:DNA (cytosine-5)-methyltransferase 1
VVEETLKPPYRVPSMDEIRATPPNGLTVVSTFSGCGGSCLGFEMQGYRVLWASEFVPAAAETYRANHPAVTLSTADIREVDGAALREEVGQVDVLEGSPPCASFSTAGRRQEGWNEIRRYSDVEQRVDDLFFEFARVLGGLQPRAFVAENVSGLARGVAKGYFKQIHYALAECGYQVEARMLDAQWLGVPQERERVIFIGVRNDQAVYPRFPDPLPYRYSMRDALGDAASEIVQVGAAGSFGTELWRSIDLPIKTIGASPQTGNGRSPPGHVRVRTAEGIVKRKLTLVELRRLCSFPDDFVLTGSEAQGWERLGRAVPPLMMARIAASVTETLRAA